MPQIKSAMKRVKTIASKNLRNTSQRSEMRSTIKKFEVAAEAGSKDTEQLFRNASKAIDMAKSKGLIKPNKAARDKSRLAKLNSK
ncbi:30S ribosomal protein S20 [Companilactobacillus sp. RD055328]|uniref:30S ribosomal protein S20 n=1 Tax=Companilactobacillus sp. RD055328 TaxID=2916634 RepID=UPI001FC8C439|nr:30S ribosomal protein S20 [Companilactobacillus sp. RD055328]GKQ42811.1 30S ribosomal protein S20 [Companilactobacillus sp. RD055328]